MEYLLINKWIKLINLFALIPTIILLNSCNYRTPSKDRFEKITKIKISNSIKVTEDRFESSGPDYSLFFKFYLIESYCLNFKSQIIKSEEWIKKNNSWDFYKTVDGTIYNITFSLQECQITYREDLI